MTAFPTQARPSRYVLGEDAAKYVITRSQFERPTLRIPPNGATFEWPLGLQGFRISGRVGNAQHLYLGDNAPVVQIVHRDARSFEMSGEFLGKTASQNARDLMEVVTSPNPQGYWILRLPAGIFPKEQLVVIDGYDFDHTPEDRTDSFSYTIAMIRTGVGNTISGQSDPDATNPPGGPTTNPPRGETGRTFTTRDGADTLRLIANIVYGDPSLWQQIYQKNKEFFDKFNIPLVKLQYVVLGPGMKLNV